MTPQERAEKIAKSLWRELRDWEGEEYEHKWFIPSVTQTLAREIEEAQREAVEKFKISPSV